MLAVLLGYLVSQLGLQCLQLPLAALLLTSERVLQLLQLSSQGSHLLPMPLRCPAQAVPLLLQACNPSALLRSHLCGHKTVAVTVPRANSSVGSCSLSRLRPPCPSLLGALQPVQVTALYHLPAPSSTPAALTALSGAG